MQNRPKLTMHELFSGISAQKRGIENLGLFDLEVVSTSDIDKDAILANACIHYGLNKTMLNNGGGYNYPTLEEMIADLERMNIGYDYKKKKPYDWNRNKRKVKQYWLACKLQKQIGDISRIKTLPYADLLTFSYPCTSISISGKQEGMVENKTQSGLVFEVIRILKQMKLENNLPKYLFLENVKALVSKKFIKDFEAINDILSDIGYNCYYSVINAKDCNIPQNRERVFGMYIRKDIDNANFTFPNKVPLEYRLKDLLLDEVDEKYLITDGQLFRMNIDKKTIKNTTNILDISQSKREKKPREYDLYSPALCARDYKDPKCVQIGNLSGDKWDKLHDCCKRVYHEEGISPTCHTCGGGNTEIKVQQTVGEFRRDKGLYCFEDNVCGTLRTITGGR